MAKRPTPEEFLNDPKYADDKGFFKSIFAGLAAEMEVEIKSKGKGKQKEGDDDENIFDSIFGSK